MNFQLPSSPHPNNKFNGPYIILNIFDELTSYQNQLWVQYQQLYSWQNVIFIQIFRSMLRYFISFLNVSFQGTFLYIIIKTVNILRKSIPPFMQIDAYILQGPTL